MFDFRSIWHYDVNRPPSGAIPRFPVWEVTVLFFVGLGGLIGLLTPEPGRLIILLGGGATIWYVVLAVTGFGSLAGMAMRPPTGLLVQLACCATLFAASAAVTAGLVAMTGELFFPGAISLYVFVIGAGWRTLQLLGQMWRLNRQMHALPRRGGRQ